MEKDNEDEIKNAMLRHPSAQKRTEDDVDLANLESSIIKTITMYRREINR